MKDIDMKAYGKPIIKWFGDGERGGYTLVQLIETSCITAHFSEERNAVFLDVFSCKQFDPFVVRGLVKEYFKAESMNEHFIPREPPQELR